MKNLIAQKTIARVRRKFGKFVHQHELLKENDVIVIGLSGGKDSLALADLLAYKRRQLKFNFRLNAVHVTTVGIGYVADTDFIVQFCKDRNINFELIKSEVALSEQKKATCVGCSRARRNALFQYAQAEKATKLALGHHKTDAVETLLLNMLHQSNISSLPEKLDLFHGRLSLIRPLLTLTDSELADYAKAAQFRQMHKECPFSNSTNRHKIRTLISELNQDFPHAEHNLFKSMQNIYPEYLPTNSSEL